MNNDPVVFSKEFFLKHQKALLWFANTSYGKGLLGIHDSSIFRDEKIDLILPHALVKKVSEDEYIAEFRTHRKYAKRLYYEFLPFWKAMHWFDMNIANPMVPDLNLGFDTLVNMPDAGTGNTTVDGCVGRNASGSWNTIRSGNGDMANATDVGTSSNMNIAGVVADNTDTYIRLRRGIFTFDTSSLTQKANISSATLSLYGHAKNSGVGATDLYICSAEGIASPNSLSNSDFQAVRDNTTSFGSVAYASYSISGYNDIALNDDGKAAVDLDGITKLCTKLGFDILNQAPTWGAGNPNSRFDAYFADQSGTSQDPKLTVNFRLPGGGAFLTMFM